MLNIDKTDVVVIGGGITGTAIVRELSKYELDVVLLEKNPDIASGSTKANSGILHAGFDAKPGSLKATLNVRGNKLYHDLEDELGLDIKWTGSLVVAVNSDEQETLKELLERGRTNGVPGLAILSREEVLAREPNITPNVTGALWAPSAGIFLPFGAALAFAENAVKNGAKVVTDCPVEEMVTENGKITGVRTKHGFLSAKYVINAAGVHADEISRLAGDDSFAIKPRKGEYILFDKKVSNLVQNVLFPTPSKVSKGILVSPTVHGNIFIGPNAQDVDDKEDVATSLGGLQEIVSKAQQLLPKLPLNAAITQFSGLRAAADGGGDFIIRPSAIVQGLFHAAGIQSPGLTSAPAIAEMLVNILKDQGMELKRKVNFDPVNPRKIVFRELSHAAQQQLIAQNPLYGRVICRCETITEAEIIEAIHGLCGARTVDAVKRRTRAGMGRCQGGFCGPRVTAILARELNIPVTAVRKDSPASYLFFDKLTADCREALQ
ncbi:NAD(P)/FAD-dependent oxidoreductase [Sporomusa acidovorans]|uniref:L-2-hydroxyglutarate dehydrogenase n=1 Tax=Sporomusa acidovorans (strain ATCC 49682 / DSM 3132 / Mol) TaxID=1123286 RepID=A0ABZ3J672_SPOA4|nr:NAD(P)/FAD-dependent oxidoreductase [Sporomusa acidovorans]OZC15372.1 L-2-hydroxyglutarate oxidase LhgO [Sporomusa acidovorans DSM 3132]SDF13989.1 glycerol-3-phosphate dehydrogenase [Sporomusa acidovorans]